MFRTQSVETLADILPKSAKYFEEKRALVYKDTVYTYQELEVITNKIANSLINLGVEKNDRVSIYFGNCVEWIMTYYAVAKIGAIVNPINVMLTPAEVIFVVNDNQAKVLVISEEKEALITDVKHQFQNIQTIITTGKNPSVEFLNFHRLVENGSHIFQMPTISPDDISTICYTSGTTGHPKGAALTHKGVIVNSAMTANMHIRTDRDVIVTALPTSHVYGNVVMNGAFMVGATLVLIERFNELEVLEAIQKYRATMLEGVPTMYLYLLNYPEIQNYDLSSLEKCTVGGQTMAINKMVEVESVLNCPLVELWGMTEISGLGTTHPLYGTNKHGSIGISLPYCQCRIADMDDARLTLPTGEVGELMIRGPIVMKEYWGNEKATLETIEPDGWLHSGDVAYMDDEGYIFIVDRKKDMILTGGFNVYPAEIERIISQHPKIALAAVGKIPDAIKGELAKAFIILKQGEVMTEEEVITFCRKHLAAYKVPRAVEFVDDVPKTSSGKIMRRELTS